jgi:penicillin-insensitive murein endopeptidase
MHGRLVDAVELPGEGKNYISYSSLPGLLGRTYVHSKVSDVVISAYKILETEQPDKVFKYAETGFKEGGQFKPHKTHQNGLSVDFMTPVLSNGKSVHLPTHPFNKFGYSIEFDKTGRYKEYTIDYEALAAHLVALHKTAKKHRIKLWRVLFDPQLQPNLYKTQYADYIKKHIQLSKKRSWVRHDEHYHVDFIIKCKPI